MSIENNKVSTYYLSMVILTADVYNYTVVSLILVVKFIKFGGVASPGKGFVLYCSFHWCKKAGRYSEYFPSSYIKCFSFPQMLGIK